MIYALYTLFILSCLAIIVSVLLQPGKADAGALFTSSISSTAFGPRGTQTLLAKITIIATIVFMLSALLLSVPYFTGARSVLQSVDEPSAPAATPAPAQQSTPAPQENNLTAPASNANSSGGTQPAQANQNNK